jgi:glutamate---cysteine ligase / carboxylate-amine ligase
MEPPLFTPSDPFTIGVELEFQLLDGLTHDLTPMAPQLLARVPAHYSLEIKPEFIQSMVEVSTPVCENMHRVEQELIRLCRHLEVMAADLGCVIFAASLHPFASHDERRLSPGSRYLQIIEDLQLAGRRLITQAMHVHIGIADENLAVKVCNSIREYLPILLALTTSSPYFEGEDTGFYSYRTDIFQALPRSGIPETLTSWRHFQELILLLNEATLLQGIKELWWDVRPHPDFGTLEIRICDLPSRFDEILAITALCQALVAWLAGKNEASAPYRETILNSKWHACRYGLDGTWISSRHNQHRRFAEAAADLIEELRPTATALKGASYFPPLRRILTTGTSSHRQRRLFAEAGDFRIMIETMRGEFWK